MSEEREHGGDELIRAIRLDAAARARAIEDAAREEARAIVESAECEAEGIRLAAMEEVRGIFMRERQQGSLLIERSVIRARRECANALLEEIRREISRGLSGDGAECLERLWPMARGRVAERVGCLSWDDPATRVGGP